MGYVEDRWFNTVKQPDGSTIRAKSARHGTGNRHRVRYVGPDGKERSESFPDRAKRQADAFLVSVESDKLHGVYIDPAAGRISFTAYAETWLRTQTFDESTREATEYKVRKHVLPYFGAKQLSAIRPAHIREWDSELVDVLAQGTRSVIFAHLRSILAAAVDDGRIPKNPCSAKSVQQPSQPQRKAVPWRFDEVTAIRAGLAPRYQAIVDVGAGCGMRQGEIFGLGVEDLDLDDGWTHVRRQLKRVLSRLIFGPPKNDKDRRVPLPESVADVLRQHVKDYPPVEITLPWESPFSTETVTARLVFASTRDGGINRATFDALSWRPALKRAGIVPSRATGMHALRHFYASALLDGGESIKALATYLGHSDPGFTLRTYTHLMPASEERTRMAIDRLFRPEIYADGPQTAQTGE
jgi:integrase